MHISLTGGSEFAVGVSGFLSLYQPCNDSWERLEPNLNPEMDKQRKMDGWSGKISANDSELSLQDSSIICVSAAHKYTTC